MESASEMFAAFPRRPLRLRFGWRARGATWGGLAAIAGLLGWLGYTCATQVPVLLQEGRIWRDGRTVRVLDVRGECRLYVNFMLLSDCDLFATYERTPGQIVRHEVSGLIFGGLDSPLPQPVVKVDPADPDRFALNAMIDQTGARWFALAEISLAVLIVCALIGLGVWIGLRDVWLWRALARDPQPQAVRVTGSRLVRIPAPAREVSFEYQHAGRSWQARQRFPVLPAKRGTPRSQWRYEEPIRLDAPNTSCLALVGARGARLVPVTFRPLVLTDEEREGVLATTVQVGPVQQ